MNAIAVITGRELQEGLRNRWVLGASALLAAFALTLAFLGGAPAGEVGASRLAITVVSLSSLSIFLLPLIALLLSYDAIVGEIERGAMALLLTYPVSRGEVLTGKFLGHLAIVTIATVLGYGAAGVALLVVEPDADVQALSAFAGLIGSSVMLGAVFVALGYLVSAACRSRAAAAALAIGVWLGFVLIWDMALLGVLVTDQGRTLSGGVVNGLLLFNPTDAYRLLNLTGFSKVSAVAGMTVPGAQATLKAPVLIASLAAWIALPLAAAGVLFKRRQL